MYSEVLKRHKSGYKHLHENRHGHKRMGAEIGVREGYKWKAEYKATKEIVASSDHKCPVLSLFRKRAPGDDRSRGSLEVPIRGKLECDIGGLALGKIVCTWTKIVIKTPELSRMVDRDVDIEPTNLGLYERLSSILHKLPLQYDKDGATTLAVVSSYRYSFLITSHVQTSSGGVYFEKEKGKKKTVALHFACHFACLGIASSAASLSIQGLELTLNTDPHLLVLQGPWTLVRISDNEGLLYRKPALYIMFSRCPELKELEAEVQVTQPEKRSRKLSPGLRDNSELTSFEESGT
ncbi:hypothetical protein BJY52DRAFT_1227166 [Lactarius psammicola]|nr:hypothetical protein BJY52DRAFT_1227166 [Lactarius psammicola]